MQKTYKWKRLKISDCNIGIFLDSALSRVFSFLKGIEIENVRYRRICERQIWESNDAPDFSRYAASQQDYCHLPTATGMLRRHVLFRVRVCSDLHNYLFSCCRFNWCSIVFCIFIQFFTRQQVCVLWLIWSEFGLLVSFDALGYVQGMTDLIIPFLSAFLRPFLGKEISEVCFCILIASYSLLTFLDWKHHGRGFSSREFGRNWGWHLLVSVTFLDQHSRPLCVRSTWNTENAISVECFYWKIRAYAYFRIRLDSCHSSSVQFSSVRYIQFISFRFSSYIHFWLKFFLIVSEIGETYSHGRSWLYAICFQVD